MSLLLRRLRGGMFGMRGEKKSKSFKIFLNHFKTKGATRLS
ncbi:hypothetical protein R80B4_02160 [Fibrobacteres bacterium R8-0-B4]